MRQKGTLEINSNIEPQMQAPLDARLVVETKADLYTFQYSYPGMMVAVKDEGRVYLLVGADPSLEESWEIVGSGGGGEDLFFIPVDEATLSQSAVQGNGVMEGVLTSPYTFEDIFAQHEAGKLCAVRLSNTADGTKDVFLPLAFSGDAESVGSQGWSEHLYFDYAGGSVAQPTPMMMTVSVVKQTGGTKIYVTKTAITAGGGGSAYDDTELRAMIGDTAQLQTAAHELVGAINELQTGNVFPVVNPSKITSDPLVFLRASSNADEFWLYNINGYPGNPVDISAYVPAGSNSFYLRTDLIYSKKGEPVNPRGYTSTVECFMTDDGFTSNPGQRSGVAYIQLYGGGTMTARIQYIPATGRLYMEGAVQLAKEEELARRPVAYTLAVDEHFISPNISYGYSKTKEFLPGAQVDLEFWDAANFPADFDLNDPTTYPTPMATYTGSIIDDDLKFTINGVVGQYNAARNVIEFDMTSFPEYDSTEENGSLYIHGTMVKQIDSALIPSGGGGGGSDTEVTVGNEGLTAKSATNKVKIINHTDGVLVKSTSANESTEYFSQELPNKAYVDARANNSFIITKDVTSYDSIASAYSAAKELYFYDPTDGTGLKPVMWATIDATEQEAVLQVKGNDASLDFWTVTGTTHSKTTLKIALDSSVGDLTALTTTVQTDLVSAINEVKFSVDGLGEPFRVKQWMSSTLTTVIPSCNQDIDNTSIDNLDFRIINQEATDFQVVGMIAYEVFDADSKRINCWPVCQFTGEGQTMLRVRMMCAGTTNKTAKRISAWVLLKHR